MVTVSVWVPWRPAPSRMWAMGRVIGWYAAHGHQVHTVDTGAHPFSLAACRNQAVALATTDVVVINDADTIPEIGPLQEAIAAAAVDGLTHLPYRVGGYRVLGPVGTAQLEAGRPIEECAFSAFDFSCSGVYVTTPAAWAAHHGQDEMFEGWSPEDFAWRITHETLLGPIPRHNGHVYALHHDAAPRTVDTSLGGARLLAYQDAAGDRHAVETLATEALRRL